MIQYGLKNNRAIIVQNSIHEDLREDGSPVKCSINYWIFGESCLYRKKSLKKQKGNEDKSFPFEDKWARLGQYRIFSSKIMRRC